MRTYLTAAFAAGTLFTSTVALTLRERSEAPAKVVSLDLQRTRVSDPLQRDRLRRRGTAQAALDNEQTLYFVNGSIGTPAQSMRLHVDTGSSDLWVNTPSSSLCLQRGQPCQFAGTYTANSSSTYAYVGSWFNISYVDGSGASGDYATDTVTIGAGNTLTKLQFGVGYKSTSAQGILGIGYTSNEVQVNRANKSPYNNLPAQMVADGVIQSNAYSLWLNDLDASTGSILFGGVDTAQYTGSLQTLPIQQVGGGFSEFLITLTGLSLGGTSVASNAALAVLLDSGSSLTYLPEAWVQQMYGLVGATYDANQGAAYIPCSQKQNATRVEFTFSAPAIAVEMNELVLDLVTSTGRKPTFADGTTACLFGVAPSGGGTNVLGDTFLRSAYVVYDLANNEISLAQTNFNSTQHSVREITTGSASVPDATKVANPAAAASGVLGGGPVNSNGSGSSNAAGRPVGASPLRVLVSIAVAGVIVTLVC